MEGYPLNRLVSHGPRPGQYQWMYVVHKWVAESYSDDKMDRGLSYSDVNRSRLGLLQKRP
jgi:hypothetical protein